MAYKFDFQKVFFKNGQASSLQNCSQMEEIEEDFATLVFSKKPHAL